MKFIEDKQVAYVLSCKMSARLQSTIYGIKNWQAMGLGIWITEIEFKQVNWSKSRRIIIIKQQEEVRKKTQAKNLQAFLS